MIDAHRGAFEYDWRTRFHLPVSVVGKRAMSWGEALRLARVLAADTSSQVCAALSEWTHPATRGELVLMDLYDATVNAHFKKPKPTPRPWDLTPKRFGSRVEDVAVVLAAHRAAIDATREQLPVDSTALGRAEGR